jgi:hypothetical protein
MTVGQETSCQESEHVPQGVCRDAGGTRSVASLPFAEGLGVSLSHRPSAIGCQLMALEEWGLGLRGFQGQHVVPDLLHIEVQESAGRVIRETGRPVTEAQLQLAVEHSGRAGGACWSM